jgi:signal transduction histidine kinase
VLSLVLLVLPWLVLRYQREMDAFVLEGRKSALLLAAQGLATVLSERADLFDENAGLPIGIDESADFAPRELEAPVKLDGSGRDWSALEARRRGYGREQTLQSVQSGESGTLSFDLSLGVHREHLYALVEVSDDVVAYRHDRYRSLDRSDHLRIGLRDASGGTRRLVVTASEAGPISTYHVGESWRYADGDGLPVRTVRGHWRETPEGYTVELRLPLEMLGSQPEIGLAVADVDRSAGTLSHVVGTFPEGESESLSRVRLHSAEIERILRGIDLPGARVSVIDRLARVRAELGADVVQESPRLRDELLRAALREQSGAWADGLEPAALHASEAGIAGAHAGERLTRAAWPIHEAGAVTGAVLIEQSNREILAHQRTALERVLVWMLVACVGIAALLWIFAWRVTHRIHALRDDAAGAIAPDGRLVRTEVNAGSRSGDEIGDLSRTITELLGRLARYTRFLETIPRTLRHELSNPLNVLSTSLENLVIQHPEIAQSKYVASAERGVERASAILASLTDAASLEEALRDEEAEEVDLSKLVTLYVENFAASWPAYRFELVGASASVTVVGSGFRVEQMLDKLLDNAVSFAAAGSVIGVAVEAERECVRLLVTNEGPRLPAAMADRVFDSMVSGRAAGSGSSDPRSDGRGPHLGLGLYVVGRIAEHMGGRAWARDRDDGRGVVVELELPRSGG